MYEAHAQALGVEFTVDNSPAGSTDMGNVSYVVPSLHPSYGVGPGDVNVHTRPFAAVAGMELSTQFTHRDNKPTSCHCRYK